MKPEVRPIGVSIVDFMGAFLPGLVWLVLLVTAGELIGILLGAWQQNPNFTPLNIILDLLGEGRSFSGSVVNRGTPFYIALAVVGLLLGYSIKPLATRYAEVFASLTEFRTARKNKMKFKELRFPYHYLYRDEKFYQEIVDEVGRRMGYTLDEKSRILATQPFSSCKRILKTLNPALWEENEYHEAEVRMMGSLVQAAFFNVLCAGLSVCVNGLTWVGFIWFASAIGIVTLMLAAFKKSRHAEVAYLYLNFLIAIRAKDPQPPATP